MQVRKHASVQVIAQVHNVISIVAVSLCLFSSHCATCLNLSYSVQSNDNLLIAFQVSPGTECSVSDLLSCRQN